MKSVETHGSFEETIAKSDPRLQEIARRLRQLIEEVYPQAVEVPWPRQGITGYGVGPKKMSEHFCYIALYRDSVNLGFYYGADLPDPEGLLEGTGKKLRHVKLREADDAGRPALRGLVQAALEERREALGLGGAG